MSENRFCVKVQEEWNLAYSSHIPNSSLVKKGNFLQAIFEKFLPSMKCAENKIQANATKIKMYNIDQNGHIFKYLLFSLWKVFSFLVTDQSQATYLWIFSITAEMFYCFFIMKLKASTYPDTLGKRTVHQVRDKELKTWKTHPKSSQLHYIFCHCQRMGGEGEGKWASAKWKKKP